MRVLTGLVVIIGSLNVVGQSFEFMPGAERIFIDAQFLNFFDEERKWSLFSRARATAEYNKPETNLFTGAYLNYTTKSGVGGTILGRIATLGSGMDTGIHFFKANAKVVIYALASIELKSELGYSWFSILRFTPSLNDRWKVYSSLELFSNFNSDGHVASVQRIRGGFDRAGYQFGLAINLSGIGRSYNPTDSNPGVFLRKAF